MDGTDPRTTGALDSMWQSVEAIRRRQELILKDMEKVPTEERLKDMVKAEARSESENAWRLLEAKLPALIIATLKQYEAEKEETERKILEKAGVGTKTHEHPIKAFVTQNWGWLASMGLIVAVLRPDWIGHLIDLLLI